MPYHSSHEGRRTKGGIIAVVTRPLGERQVRGPRTCMDGKVYPREDRVESVEDRARLKRPL